MPTPLTALDASFLRLETPAAHMHVAWLGLFRARSDGPPAIEALRTSIAGRLRHAPRFRQRLAFPPLGLGEPFWVDDPGFDIAAHVTLPDERPVSAGRFRALADAVLSEPLDRTRPLWHVYLAPLLEHGRCGVVCKMHHAMVDGKSAVEVGLLLFDTSTDPRPEPPEDWSPEPEPSAARLALAAAEQRVRESLAAARAASTLASRPRQGGGRLADTLRRAALAVGDDLLRPAPASHLNVPIGPQRTLVTHRVPLERLLAIKRRAGVTLNDVCLAAVAGAMRELAQLHGRRPLPLKAMVPVSVRNDAERGALGNRISFAFVELPVTSTSAHGRLARVHAQMSRLKREGRPAATESVLRAVGWLPAPLKGAAARAAGSARTFNLTVSNIPGPRFPLYMLGAELEEAYPVVPLPEQHALSIGIFSYRDEVFFGLYAEPDALPEARELPSALSSAVLALLGSRRGAGHARGDPARPATARRRRSPDPAAAGRVGRSRPHAGPQA